jgi:RsiW-degrading membrane proteinase PrsW (M82 family)
MLPVKAWFGWSSPVTWIVIAAVFGGLIGLLLVPVDLAAAPAADGQKDQEPPQPDQ